MTTFSEDDARAVAVALALDEVDRAGALVDGDTRRRLTREAIAAVGTDGNAWIAARARALLDPLRETVPKLDDALAFSDPRPSAVPWVVVALGLGAATNALGPDRAVSVLAPPLLGLILWNLVIFAMLVGRRLRGALGPGLTADSSRLGVLWRWGQTRVRRRLAALADEGTPAASLLDRYLERWFPAVTPLASARLARVLHLAAAAAVIGTVVGMYLRGIAVEYEATWESTFLGDATVDTVVGTLLAPASTLLGPLGIEVPAASTLRAPATGSAGPWIHLWATTALLFVVVPRLALATTAGASILHRRRRIALDIPHAHRQRLLASASTEEQTVEIMAYSYRPVERALQTLREQWLDLVGARARVRVASTIDYGADLDDVAEAIDERAGWRVVLFGLAQTPELEVHGELLSHLIASAADGQRVVAVVDESAFRRKLGDDAAERIDSRRRAWRRVVEEAGLDPAFVDLVGGEADAILAALERIVRSEEAA
ncbi:MAG: DUF2868 domain-containing protein [Acidobacteriota bacterium]